MLRDTALSTLDIEIEMDQNEGWGEESKDVPMEIDENVEDWDHIMFSKDEDVPMEDVKE